MRFVVADRQPTTRSALRLLVEQYPDMDYSGSTGDIDDLLKLAKSVKPNLVLVEWELLGAGPKSCITAMKEATPAVIVVLSCCLDSAVPITAGADYYVSKIEQPERLIAVIQDIRNRFAAEVAKDKP